MQFTPSLLDSLAGRFSVVKSPAASGPPSQRDPKVIATVSEMLSTIQTNGLDAVRKYAEALDNFTGTELELDAATIKASGDKLDPALRSAIELGAERTKGFALEQRAHLSDFETELVPGIATGQRYIPIQRVGAYLPAGRFPLTASAFMTVNVAKIAGVPTVLACTPPQPDGGPNAAVLYAAYVSGVDRVFLLGGVQALAAMAFGLLGEQPVDMIVGAGNAYVAEAKRQLFGTTAIDLLAGPSEVAVIADETADPELVAADLLGQAEHGPDSPGRAGHHQTPSSVRPWPPRSSASSRRSRPTRSAARRGTTTARSPSPTTARRGRADGRPRARAPRGPDRRTTTGTTTTCATTARCSWAPWSTVAYSDKGMAGTNHVLPTAGGAKHSAGLSVSRFLKPLTYQRVTKAATPLLADAVDVISESEGMSAHRATATLRTGAALPVAREAAPSALSFRSDPIRRADRHTNVGSQHGRHLGIRPAYGHGPRDSPYLLEAGRGVSWKQELRPRRGAARHRLPRRRRARSPRSSVTTAPARARW